jgi:hypothetical protein
MNSTEIQELEIHLGTAEGKTMDDYFTELSSMFGVNISTLKEEFKLHYSSITDWSF